MRLVILEMQYFLRSVSILDPSEVKIFVEKIVVCAIISSLNFFKVLLGIFADGKIFC
jgi:hypothetical protein